MPGGVFNMSLEAIKIIGQAEEKANKARNDAAVASKNAISEAEAAGRQAVEQAARLA